MLASRHLRRARISIRSLTGTAMHASFAPLPDPVEHDPRLVRLYLKQTLLRFCGGLCLLPMVIVAVGLALLMLHMPVGDGRHWWQLALPVLPALLAPLLAVNGMVRQQLRVFAEEGVLLTEELISARVTRELSSPFDIFTSFDLCAEALSGLATGQALGLAGPPAFAHDPFERIILLGRARPFRLFGATEVRLWAEPGQGAHGVKIRVRRILSGDFLMMQKGGALRSVEAVTVQLQAGLARRKAALDAAARGQAAERAALQAKLSALQAQVEPHFLFNTLANLKYLMRTEPAVALTMLDHLTDYLHSALPDLRAVSSTVGRELDLAQAYLSIMQIRMGKRLRFTIEASDAVRALPMPPAMLISLVENALKHGLEGWPHPGTVRIEVALEDGMLALRVHDDGAGFGGSAAQGAGLGLSNIHARLALLYQGAAALEVMAGEHGGVTAVLRMPLPENQVGA
jgi:hypothetical protein